MTEEVIQADRETSLAEEIRELLEGCTNGNPDDDCQEHHLLRRALAHLPTDLSEERAIETLRSTARADGWVEINVESECWQTALRAMQQYAAGLQGEVDGLRGVIEQAAADFDDHADFAQTRIEDGAEMGASVWRIALEDIKREAVDNAKRARTALGDTQ